MITKQDWANMQRDLAAALKRADEAEAVILTITKERDAENAEAKAKIDGLMVEAKQLNAELSKLSSEVEAQKLIANEAEASAALWREAAKRADEYRENNLALLGRLSNAHQANEALRQAPKARVSELEKENAKLKRRIDALEQAEGKARRDGN